MKLELTRMILLIICIYCSNNISSQNNKIYVAIGGYTGEAKNPEDCPTGKGCCATSLKIKYFRKLKDGMRYIKDNPDCYLAKFFIIDDQNVELTFILYGEHLNRYISSLKDKRDSLFIVGPTDVKLNSEFASLYRKSEIVLKAGKYMITQNNFNSDSRNNFEKVIVDSSIK